MYVDDDPNTVDSYDDLRNHQGIRGLSGNALVAGLVAIQGPEARGFSRSLDGSALHPDLTKTGITQSDIHQKFDTAIWQASAQSRLEKIVQRSYSYLEGGGSYSYLSPAADFEGAYNRSYGTSTDYQELVPAHRRGQPFPRAEGRERLQLRPRRAGPTSPGRFLTRSTPPIRGATRPRQRWPTRSRTAGRPTTR